MGPGERGQRGITQSPDTVGERWRNCGCFALKNHTLTSQSGFLHLDTSREGMEVKRQQLSSADAKSTLLSTFSSYS